jgi:hypothetical protein
MKVETIVTDAAINFYDCAPQIKEVMLEAFEHIYKHENVMEGDPDDFETYYGNGEPTNTFGGAFITCCYGSYLLHDLRVEDKNACTILYYSLSKISDDVTN